MDFSKDLSNRNGKIKLLNLPQAHSSNIILKLKQSIISLSSEPLEHFITYAMHKDNLIMQMYDNPSERVHDPVE